MKNLKIAAAVAVAMSMSTGAFALNQADTAAAATQLVVAGASAARDAFASEFLAVCQSATFNVYRASPTTNKDFRAYSCTLNNAAPVPTALRNTNATVYYRSEGGSAYGPGSIVKGIQIKRLVVDGNCTQGTNGSLTSFGDCGVPTYTLADDSGSGNIVSATTDLGVSDVEPAMFRGENWPGGALGAEPATGVLEGLAKSVGFGQAFGIAVHAPTVTIASISKEDVGSIFAGNATNWNQIQDTTTGVAGPDLPIVVCRRERGSGTQDISAIHFLQQQCGKSSEPFVTETIPNPGPGVYQVLTPDSTTALEACINSNNGAIGPNIFKATPVSGAANIKYLQIDGVTGGKLNAARGQYHFWAESAFAKRPGLSGNPDSLATLLINRARAAAGISASSASTFALPIAGVNAAVLPVNATVPSVPIGVNTKFGNTCKTPLGQL
ncbi:MAG: substrate-binding domain-containing protein [Peristeroidobacter soli]